MKKLILTVAGLLLVGLLYVGYSGWYHLFRVVETPPLADPTARFYYGTIGAEVETGMPKTMFEVAPELCADLLPGGYRSLGFIYEKGHDVPVGFGEKTIGFARVAFNCATCHHGSVRTAPDAETVVLPAGSPVRLDVGRYGQFLFDCILSDRFAADKLIPAIEKRHPLSFLERQFYRYLILPKARAVVTKLRDDNAWHRTRQPGGPGRYDAINTLRKYFGGDPAADSEDGVCDLPQIWHEAAQKKGFGLWDGSSHHMSERNRIAALLAGATPETLDMNEMAWIEAWLDKLPPPKFPFPIDEALATKGQAVYQQQCASCHEGRVGELSPFAEIGTDTARANAVNEGAVTLLNKFDRGHLTFKHFADTNAYRIPSLEGIWALAPYLHNGSVPTMRALLEAPAARPKTFYRGYDVYDPKDLGYVSTGSEAAKNGVIFDTAPRANGNQGHDYGTKLDEESKVALLEFLKKV